MALTFDDGPDPIYTAQILQTLKKYNIKATFFVVGKHVVQNPELLRQIVADGHQIENHSYSHPRIAYQDKTLLQREIQYTDSILQTFGLFTKYFRTPFNEFQARSESDLEPLQNVQNLGKLNIYDDYNSNDYISQITATEISSSIINKVRLQNGSVIVMHDSGGNDAAGGRSETVKSLDVFIPLLQSKGYQFVSLDQLQPNNPPTENILQTQSLSEVTSQISYELKPGLLESFSNLIKRGFSLSIANISILYMTLLVMFFGILMLSFAFGRISRLILK